MKIVRKLALLVAALTLAAPAVHAAKPKSGADNRGERIISYLSDITVTPDAALHVVETIRVNVEGLDIRHGIFRTFPVLYQRNGATVRVGFSVDAVELDGQPVQFVREALANEALIRIGSADTLVPSGEHTYTIHFTTTRQLGFFDTYDELYWNVTGTGWRFPIDLAEVRIHLPRAAGFGQRALYTGAQGSTASNAEVVSEDGGTFVARTTRPLNANEGLTVAVSWPKHIVTQESPSTLATPTDPEGGDPGFRHEGLKP